MKVYPESGPCMINRALLFCREGDEETRYKVVKEICGLFGKDFSRELTTTEIADRRNKLIEVITRDPDPMRGLKEESMREAEKVYPDAEEYVKNTKDHKERFKAALKFALAGNIVEFGARDHKPDLKKLREEIFSAARGPLAIDDSDKIYEKVRKAKEILYVTDNAAELVFDRILIKELQIYAKVFVAPLSKPVQDDASIKEAKETGIDRMCPIIPRSDSIGVWFPRCTKEFLKKWDEADFIIVKGMGCYETLTEYPEKTKGKVGLLMKAKCLPVATDIGVPLGGTVMKIL